MSSTIGTVYVQVEPSTKNFGSSLHGAVDSAAASAGSSSGSAFGKAFSTGAKVAGVALAAATTAVGAFAKQSITAGAEFDSAMSQVAATMGYSMAEINTEGSEAAQTFEKLNSFAKEMGSTTAFSATESAEALNYMALAGYDADTAIETLPTVLSLAAAGGMDLASASDMVTDSLSAFGLGSESAEMLVNQMAITASKSNTSVEQLGEAFLTIGANAKDLSGGTQELSTMLGVLADNGIKGSEAGTHLRNIMLSMNPTTKAAKEAWESLGVSAYDANGNLRPLDDTIGALNNAMEGMTDQEKTSVLSKMFNKTDLASVSALLATDTERFEALYATIGDAENAASNMADVQLDNLAGDITLFQSALEGAKIAVSDQLTPTLREFVSFGSEGLSRLTQAFNTDGLSGAMAEFGNILSDGLALVIKDAPGIVEAGLGLLQALVDGIISNLPMITQAALDIALMLSEYLLANLGPILEAGLQIILQLALGIAQALPELIPQIVEVVTNICIYLLENIDLLIDAAFALMGGLAIGILKALPIILAKLPTILLGIVNAIKLYYTKLWEVGKDLMSKLADGISGAWTAVKAKVSEIINNIINAFKEKVEQFKDIGKNVIDGIKQGISDAWSGITSLVTEKISGLVDGIKTLLGIHSPSKVMAEEIGRWIPAGIAEGITNGMGILNDTVEDMTTTATMEASMIAGSATYESYNSGIVKTGEDAVLELLRQYLPQIAKGNNVSVSLEGDARALFNAVKKQNNDYKRSTGRSAFA